MQRVKPSLSFIYERLEGCGLRIFVILLCTLALLLLTVYKVIPDVPHSAYLTLFSYVFLNCLIYKYYSKSQKVKFLTIALDWLLLVSLLITTQHFMFFCLFLFVLFPVDNMFLVKTKYLKLSSVGYIVILAGSITFQDFWLNSKMMGVGIIATIFGVSLYINNLLNTVDAINRQLEKLATHDTLTDLPNRGLYREHLIHTMKGTTNNDYYCSCIFVDLDGFKKVNDTYGHRIGDLLLIEVSKRIKSCLRQGDIVARLGGDEFALIAKCNVIPDESIPQRILSELKLITEIEGNPIDISASIGIAYYKDSGKEEETVDHLINKADKAMYAAKSAGKRCIRIMNEAGEIEIPTIYNKS